MLHGHIFFCGAILVIIELIDRHHPGQPQVVGHGGRSVGGATPGSLSARPDRAFCSLGYCSIALATPWVLEALQNAGHSSSRPWCHRTHSREDARAFPPCTWSIWSSWSKAHQVGSAKPCWVSSPRSSLLSPLTPLPVPRLPICGRTLSWVWVMVSLPFPRHLGKKYPPVRA